MTLDKALKIPLLKQIIFLLNLVIKNGSFWKALTANRILKLKQKGAQLEKVLQLISKIDEEPMTHVYAKYAPRFFLKVFVEDLLVAVIPVGIWDAIFNLDLRSFVIAMFFSTLSLSLIDTLSYIEVERVARIYKSDIEKMVKRAWKEERVWKIDELMRL